MKTFTFSMCLIVCVRSGKQTLLFIDFIERLVTGLEFVNGQNSLNNFKMVII